MFKNKVWDPGSMHPIFGIPFVALCIALIGLVFFGGLGLVSVIAQ